MTYQETVDYLYSQLPAFQKLGNKAVKPKLTNIYALCEMLGNPQDNFPSIHVAGTNGKGSSSHFLTSILMEAGYKVGLYTSPHLKDYRERFRINGKLVPENCIIKFVRDYGQEFSILKPSFFEVSVALAFKLFSDAKVDVAVIEVGLGGTWDSTNIISKVELALISNIGFDHTDILGDTLEQIAEQKAGIIKPGVPVVVSEYLPETRPVFEAVSARMGAELSFAQEEWTVGAVDAGIDRLSVELCRNSEALLLHSELVGKYQISNIRGVVEAVRRLNARDYSISEAALKAGISKVVENTGFKGRWQILGRKPLIICDTGHNDQAFQITFDRIAKAEYANLHFVLGFVKDKDISKIAQYIPDGASLYLSSFSSFRARTAEDLKGLKWKSTNIVSIFEDVNLALAAAKSRAGEEDIIFIGGSTYLVAEIEEL
jgi:dihydrofolate synthase/folylpolyglutamate synthase